MSCSGGAFCLAIKDYMPYDNDLGSPFIPLDFTLGLPSVQDWPCRAGEPPWILDLEEHPKPVCKVPVDSTGASSMDEGKKKKKKKKKHHHSKKSEKLELKVTTRGEGANTQVWTHARPAKDSSSSSDSQSDGDSGLGSNPSIQPRWGTDTESRQGVALRLSPDATREPMEDDPLSDWGGATGTKTCPTLMNRKAIVIPQAPDQFLCSYPMRHQRERSWVTTRQRPVMMKSLRSPKSPLEPYQIVLQGFRTVSQTLSEAYGATSAEIQIIVRKSLAKTTTKDWTFVKGPPGPLANG